MEIPQLRHLEDEQTEADARPARPMQMALRNASIALLGLLAVGGGYAVKYYLHGATNPVAWWIWPSVAAFAVVVCFAHALLASQFGARKAGIFLKIVCVMVLAGMLIALKVYLMPKEGAI